MKHWQCLDHIAVVAIASCFALFYQFSKSPIKLNLYIKFKLININNKVIQTHAHSNVSPTTRHQHHTNWQTQSQPQPLTECNLQMNKTYTHTRTSARLCVCTKQCRCLGKEPTIIIIQQIGEFYFCVQFSSQQANIWERNRIEQMRNASYKWYTDSKQP